MTHQEDFAALCQADSWRNKTEQKDHNQMIGQPSKTFNPLKIGEKWCKEIDASILLCISIDANGTIVSFSHGRTKQLCKEAGKMLDDIHDNIIKG